MTALLQLLPTLRGTLPSVEPFGTRSRRARPAADVSPPEVPRPGRRKVTMRSLFLTGCIVVALPGLVGAAVNAVQGWTEWRSARSAAGEVIAVGEVMRASTALMVERGELQAAVFAVAPDYGALARYAATTDAALGRAHDAARQAGLPTALIARMRDSTQDARSKAMDAVRTGSSFHSDSSQAIRPADAGSGKLTFRIPAEQFNRIVEALDGESSHAERAVTLASPSIGVLVSLARQAHELRGIAGRRGMLLNQWLGGQTLTATQRDDLLTFTGRLAGAWDRVVLGVSAANPSPLVHDAVAAAEKHFFIQQEPWYRELVSAAASGADRPLTHIQYRRWTLRALEHLLPLREALMTEAETQGQATIAAAQRDMLASTAFTLLSLGLIIGAVVAVLRGLVEPVRVMTASMTRLATGDLDAPAPTSNRLIEIDEMAAAFVVFRDNIGSLGHREAELRQTNLYFGAALENMSQGLCMYDAQERLTVFNRRYCEILNLPSDRVRTGMTFRELISLAHGAGMFDGRTVEHVYQERRAALDLCETGIQFDEVTASRAISVRYEPNADGGWVCTFEDVTERRAAEARIAHMAHHDALTGLPNRIMLRQRIEQELARAEHGTTFALLCLDLDRFKLVNDTLGHPVGDALLCAVGQRLGACVRDIDTVVRLGGDEFAVVQPSAEQPDNAAALARRLVDSLSAPYLVAGHRITIAASVGIALGRDDGATSDELLKNADLALYRAKEQGGAGWCFFEPTMDAQMQARRRAELELCSALETGEFTLHYQPLVNVSSRKSFGFEALLRWQHPERGLLPPSEFIALAEETGLIVPIGDWVLRRACADAARWGTDIKVAVNLSAAQFRCGRSLVESVAAALKLSGLRPGLLELEITETIMLLDSVETLAALHRLKAIGVSISMDDFGTGYSSLSYLRTFPFDKVKIDRSFVREMGAAGSNSSAIVRAMVAMCASLGMSMLAEGVETEEQLLHLSAEGVVEVQGYLFSRPVPVEGVPRLLRGAMRAA